MPRFDPANPEFDLPHDPADRERWRRFSAQRDDAVLRASNGASTHCPSEIELASWIDSRINDPAQRELIEAHLASCPVCMAAMLEVRKSLASQGESLAFVAPEILAAAKSLVAPAEIDIHVVRHVRLSRWMGLARWSGAAAASVLIGVIGWQAGQATNVTSINVTGNSSLDGTVANADDRDLLVNEWSLGALGGAEDEDDFSLLSLSFDEGSAS